MSLYNPLIMIIDDNPKFARLLELELSDNNFASRHISPANYAQRLVNFTINDVVDDVISSGCALCIINCGSFGGDLMLAEAYERLRSRCNISCIILYRHFAQIEQLKSSVREIDDMLLLRHPFEIETLLSSIKYALAASSADVTGEQKLIYIDGLIINEASHSVQYMGAPVELTKKEFDLLRFLAIRRGTAISRREIFNKVWGFDYYGDTNVVDVYIRYLRTKIDNRFGIKLVVTVRGIGYSIK